MLGTREDNAQDAISRGRMKDQAMDLNNNARLSKIDVVEIKRRRKAGETQVSVAQAFNISISQVGHITAGRRWAGATE